MFSGGGMLSALFLPATILVLWIAGPLGWLETASYADLVSLWRNPVVRLFLFVLISLSLFHWAHRFRYTLYDGLQLYHLNETIAVLTYGVATLLTLVGAYVTFFAL